MTKSNKNITIIKDRQKSYVYVRDGKKEIGILMWHYKKKKWIFEDGQCRNEEQEPPPPADNQRMV